MKDSLTYFNELKEVIYSNNMSRFLRYIKSIPTEDFEKVIKVTDRVSELSIWSYFSANVQLGPLSRGQRGDNLQQLMAKLAFLAVADYKVINNWYIPNDFLLTEEYGKLLENFDEYFIEILTYRRVKWLNKWLNRNRWRTIPYTTIYKLHCLGLLKHDKPVFLRSLVGLPFLNLTNFDAHDYIKNNDFLIENDLYSIFEYELYFMDGNNLWLEIFQFLINEKKIEKSIILNKCIEAIKRNFKRNFINQFRELFIKLNPSVDEKLALQHELFELFNQPLAANVSFAIDQIKTITEQKGFDIEAFLLNTESILPRNDLKTGIKTILSICEKIAKKQPDFSAQICMLVTNCLISSESSIQEKAAKIIKNYSNKNDEMLLASISTYTEQLNKTTLEFLQNFISIDDKSDTSAENTEYHYIPQTFPKSTEGKPVEYISNWNDLLFQVGKALKSTDPIDAELLFDGIIRLQNQFPDNYKEQLEPYLKQLNNFSQNSYIGNIQRFIKEWGAVTLPTFYDYGLKTDPFIRLFTLQLKGINSKLKSKSNLPLLSTPTHSPFWLSSDVFVDRLLLYQNANEIFDDVDFLLAISRISIDSSTETIQKIHKLNNISRSLLLYLLLDNQEIIITKSSFIENTTQTITKYFSKLGNKIQLTDDDREALLWAVVARTKQSNGIFKEFEETTLKTLPNVVKPYELDWKIIQWGEYISWNQKTILHNRLKLNSINDKLEINESIYSLGYFGTKSANDFIDIFADDIKSIYSLSPNYPESFYFKVIQEYAEESTTGSNLTKEAFHESLKTLLLYKPNIENSANLFLATGFLSNAPMNRDLSVEIFIQSVIEQRLDVKQLGQNIGKLLGGNYAPIQRLSDSLLSLKNISELNDIALILFFENMLIEFSDELSKGFTKLLEFYNELLLNYNRKVCIEVEQKLNRWQENTTLKKQLIKMKGLIR